MKSKILGLFSVSLVLVLCGWLFSRQGVLRLSSIEVESLNDDELLLLVKRKIAPFLGANLLTLSLADLQENLQQDKRIKKVFISRKFPSTLSLKIVPRFAIASSVNNAGSQVIVGDEGTEVEGYLTKETLPTWLKYQSCDELCRDKTSTWLSMLRQKQPEYFQRIVQLEWLKNRGLVLSVQTTSEPSEFIQIEMGTDDFLSKWRRVKLAVDLISERQIHGERLMALRDGQVVISGVKNLHNLKNELNLKEMVRRATQQSDTRALAR